MKTPLELIINERHRQITDEGHTSEVDDLYDHSELPRAAECYVRAAIYELASGQPQHVLEEDWPWDASFWKPTGGVVRQIVKAGALHQAEHERLQRRDPHLYFGPYSAQLPRICMFIDRASGLLAKLDAEVLRVLREIRDFHSAAASKVAVDTRFRARATEDDRHSLCLHESFVGTIVKVLRSECARQ